MCEYHLIRTCINQRCSQRCTKKREHGSCALWSASKSTTTISASGYEHCTLCRTFDTSGTAVSDCVWGAPVFEKYDGSCRTRSNGRGTPTEYDVNNDRCKQMCRDNAACTGIEVRGGSQCEIHTDVLDPDLSSKESTDRDDCYIKTGQREKIVITTATTTHQHHNNKRNHRHNYNNKHNYSYFQYRHHF